MQMKKQWGLQAIRSQSHSVLLLSHVCGRIVVRQSWNLFTRKSEIPADDGGTAFQTCLFFTAFVYPLLITAPSGWNLNTLYSLWLRHQKQTHMWKCEMVDDFFGEKNNNQRCSFGLQSSSVSVKLFLSLINISSLLKRDFKIFIWLVVGHWQNNWLVKAAVMTNDFFPLCDCFHFLWIYSCLRCCVPVVWKIAGLHCKSSQSFQVSRSLFCESLKKQQERYWFLEVHVKLWIV